jgi:hypothetical protein
MTRVQTTDPRVFPFERGGYVPKPVQGKVAAGGDGRLRVS